MSIYAMGDLHLSFNDNKPMDIFGDNWSDHPKKIEENWKDIIKDDDLVVLPGDFSWAMYLKDTIKDFEYLNKLPGKKVFLKGNHDYWWTTITSMNNYLLENKIENVSFVLNNAIRYKDYAIVGTRGWSFGESENSEKMLKRELNRLENSIKYCLDNFTDISPENIICALHYPPITKNMISNNSESEYLKLLNKYSIKTCIYGHLHGKSHSEAVEGNVNGIELKLVSSDFLNFKPYLLVN